MISPPPKGMALLLVLGPGLIWCGEFIGSGEVILAPRAGAILGLGMLWVPVVAIFLKYWIGLAGARYTVCTGEGMIDMLSRTPGPKNWVIWPVFIGQLAMGMIATGALVSSSGAFAAYFFPAIPPYWLGWIILAFILGVTWTGRFGLLKSVMSLLVTLIILGALDAAAATWPGWSAVAAGILGFNVPEIPAWAKSNPKVASTGWAEILPLLGWAAGGFASQVWYTYWVLGAGYGMAKDRGYGRPLEGERLASVTVEEAGHLRGWCGVVTKDATLAMVIGVVVTTGFALAGAGVLAPAQLAPEGPDVPLQISRMFAERWGDFGAHLFVLAGLAALISTLLGQFAGWPRLLADCARLLFPKVAEYSWKVQFRAILSLFAFWNALIVFTLGLKPVFLVKLGAVLDGLLLTPLQALAVGWVLYRVMPRFFPAESARLLRPSPIFAVGLALAFLVFGYFCVIQIPSEFTK